MKCTYFTYHYSNNTNKVHYFLHSDEYNIDWSILSETKASHETVVKLRGSTVYKTFDKWYNLQANIHIHNHFGHLSKTICTQDLKNIQANYF